MIMDAVYGKHLDTSSVLSAERNCNYSGGVLSNRNSSIIIISTKEVKMGARAQVIIKGTGHADLYFYTHWGANTIIDTVSCALDRGRSRWDDPSYLARIIFSEMIKDDVMELIGYGISTESVGDSQWDVIVDVPSQTVTCDAGPLRIKNMSFRKFADFTKEF